MIQRIQLQKRVKNQRVVFVTNQKGTPLCNLHIVVFQKYQQKHYSFVREIRYILAVLIIIYHLSPITANLRAKMVWRPKENGPVWSPRGAQCKNNVLRICLWCHCAHFEPKHDVLMIEMAEITFRILGTRGAKVVAELIKYVFLYCKP